MARRFQVNGDTLNFPDGMSDEDIKVALDTRYGDGKYKVTDASPPTAPAATAGAKLPKGATPAQQAAYQQYSSSPDYSAAAAQGDPSNLIVKVPGTELPVGASYMDETGKIIGSNKGKTSEALGLYEGLVRPTYNVATWMKGAAGKILSPEIANKIDVAGNRMLGLPRTEEVLGQLNDLIKDKASQGIKPGVMGNIAGGAIATAPLLGVTKNPLMAGAGGAALSTRNPTNPASVAMDAGLGGILGKAGDVAGRVAGSVIAPRIRSAVQTLLDNKVELTPGQIVGGLPHRMEDATRSIYGVGDMVIGAQARAQKSFVTGAVQQSLDDIGVKLPMVLEPGHAQVEFAQKALSDAYNAVLPTVKAQMDPTFAHNLVGLRQMAQQMPPDQQHVFEAYVQGDLKRAFSQNGTVTGETFKDLESNLGQKIRRLRSSGGSTSHDQDLADAFSELQMELRDLVARNDPAAAKTIGAINSGYAKLVRVEKAASGAVDGVFTPDALRRATISLDSSTRNKAAARGDALMQDYANSAASVMKNTIPDSGTPARALATGAAGAALFGGSGLSHIQVNPWAASALAAMAAPYASRATGAAARAALTARPALAMPTRELLEKALQFGVPALAAGQAGVNRQGTR